MFAAFSLCSTNPKISRTPTHGPISISSTHQYTPSLSNTLGQGPCSVLCPRTLWSAWCLRSPWLVSNIQDVRDSDSVESSVYMFRRSAKNVHVCCVLALLQTQNHHLVCHGTASSPRLCATHPIFQSFGDRTDVLSCFQNLHVGGLMSAAFLVLFNMFEISTLNSLLVVCSKTTAKRLMFAASLLVLKTFKITSPIAPWRRLFLCNIWPPKFDDLKIMFCLFLETVFGYGNICCVLALLETLKMISREAPTPLFL